MGVAMSLSVLILGGCKDTATDVGEKHSVYEIIEHGCLHMRDAGVIVHADSVMPGPHLDAEDFEHKRLNVVLTSMPGGKGGYIHFGPDISGDMCVMMSEDAPLAVTNRTTAGDTELEIEQSFSARQIADSAGCTLVKKAVIFEAQKGGNIIKIGPAAFDTINVIIEEARHAHSH